MKREHLSPAWPSTVSYCGVVIEVDEILDSRYGLLFELYKRIQTNLFCRIRRYPPLAKPILMDSWLLPNGYLLDQFLLITPTHGK